MKCLGVSNKLRLPTSKKNGLLNFLESQSTNDLFDKAAHNANQKFLKNLETMSDPELQEMAELFADYIGKEGALLSFVGKDVHLKLLSNAVKKLPFMAGKEQEYITRITKFDSEYKISDTVEKGKISKNNSILPCGAEHGWYPLKSRFWTETVIKWIRDEISTTTVIF